jgi:hypothetical protein
VYEVGVAQRIAAARVAGCPAGDYRYVRIVAGVLHRERREDVRLDEIRIRHVGAVLDDIAQQQVAGVRVRPLLARSELERLVLELRDEIFQRCLELLELLELGKLVKFGMPEV